uniref:Uncharacterized protein n=1 Tax=Arundo donax TaxID=35708 RepID=A0A0A9DIM5_ARUDO
MCCGYDCSKYELKLTVFWLFCLGVRTCTISTFLAPVARRSANFIHLKAWQWMSLINYNVLLHVHQCCPDFVELNVSALYVDEEMASVICNSLPHLKKLEIPSSDMSSAAIIKFLDCLEELEYLDISGYETSVISSTILEKASRLKDFLWNSKFELGEFVDCSNCGEHSFNPQEPCKCMMEHKVMDWLAGPSQTS